MNTRKTFRFALLGATALTLAGCGESKEEALTYKSVEACISAGVVEAATCRAEFTKAQRRHTEVAPRYRTSNDCNTDFGYNRCYQHRTSSGSIWLPFMVGYMLAPRGGAVYTQPLYRPSSDPGNFYTARNKRVSRPSTTGRTQVAKSAVSRPQARTRTVARGGFGARARSSGS